ncbi:uncharacterized protein LOC142323197 isoform X2 [Lycorma delicatula]|uniref:uncharacterized protein LOC142323197 isoform X2 n=1 Tax=Lycorma delicatula TaxID=130591 RepID=UPI003F510727
MGQNELAAQPQFELLSWTFSVDVDWWPNLIPHHHTEVEWIEFSESIGLVCHISTDRSSLGIDSVKVSGVFLLIGIGSWLCCKLIKLYHTTINNRNGHSSESQGKFGSIFKTCYFGPTSSTGSTSAAVVEEDRVHGVPEADIATASVSVVPMKRTFKCKSETDSCVMKSSPVRHVLSTNSSPILNGKDRLDCDSSSVSIVQETSSDNISELSFDIDNTTFARLDQLQQEIDQIKSSCLSMDEEFVTIKGSRNLPGLSSLMEACELNEEPQTEQIENAKRCFKGLYSLTTINQSISLELANYQTTPTEESKDCNKIAQSAEEENLPSLEWDELEDTSDRNIKLNSHRMNCGSVTTMDCDSLQSSQMMTESWSCSDFIKDEMCVDSSPSYESGNWSSYSISEVSSTDNEIVNIGPKVDVMMYAAHEWKGTSKRAETIRRGYSEVVNSLGLKHLHRVRGDNYCAIRATLFQILTHGIAVPSAEQVYNILCQGSSQHLMKSWQFSRLPYSNNINEGVRMCLVAFDQLVAAMADVEDKPSALQNWLNADPVLDLQLNEAVKLLMLERTIHLFDSMNIGQNVPLFAVLLFARDTCVTICDFMNNHLCRVGDTGGLEMVEMYLLGYTLNVTLRVVRPSAFGTEDFICFFPEENTKCLPEITVIAEDDRHYNILVK